MVANGAVSHKSLVLLKTLLWFPYTIFSIVLAFWLLTKQTFMYASILQDRIKIPRDFFRKWGKKLHKKVIIDDGCGNFSSADIVVENHKAKKAAFFVNGVKDIVQIYYKHGSCLVYSRRQNSAKGPSTTHPLPGPLKGATTIIGWEKLMTYAIVNSSQALVTFSVLHSLIA